LKAKRITAQISGCPLQQTTFFVRPGAGSGRIYTQEYSAGSGESRATDSVRIKKSGLKTERPEQLIFHTAIFLSQFHSIILHFFSFFRFLNKILFSFCTFDITK